MTRLMDVVTALIAMLTGIKGPAAEFSRVIPDPMPSHPCSR
jgi:hypothetical protein